MTSFGTIWLIIKREYWTRVRKRSFILLTLLGPLLMAGVALGIAWLSDEEPEQQRILVISDSYPMFEDLSNTDLITYHAAEMSIDQALASFQQSSYTAILYVPGNVFKLKAGELYFKKQPSFRVQRQIELGIQQYLELKKLAEFNISESDYRRLKAPFNLNTFQYDPQAGTSEERDRLPIYIGLLFSILIFLFVFMYSVQVMRGVMEEKTNRIIEVIISSVRPFQLMMGKIVGVGAVGLTQFLLWVVLTLGGLSVGRAVVFDQLYDASNVQTEQMTDALRADLSERDLVAGVRAENAFFQELDRVNFAMMIGMFLCFFLGGFLLYSAMMAAVGSLADTDTDTQQFVFPITSPLFLSYIAAFIIFENPESSMAQWLSYVPFTSPVVMMIRISYGVVTIWEALLSLVLLFGTFLAMVWVSAKVYRTGILMYGKPVSWREVFKWIRYH